MTEATGTGQFDYFAWRKQAETFPCAPAKGFPKLAESPDKILYRNVLESGEREIAAELEQLVAKAIGDGAHLLVARVDGWTDEYKLARSLAALRDQHGWALKRLSRGILNPSPYLRVGVHRVVARHPEDGAPIESVPMILGPFEQFPTSRSCPRPIFEMSVCTAKTTKVGSRHRINFLGIPTPKLSEAQREGLIAKAKEDTEVVNGGEDSRAKPSVTATFAVSVEQVFN
ncbi:MAG: hypothetical protein QM759_11850 [Terricaulis sp.]